MVYVSETLTVALHSLQGLEEQQEEFTEQHFQHMKSNSKSPTAIQSIIFTFKDSSFKVSSPDPNPIKHDSKIR